MSTTRHGRALASPWQARLHGAPLVCKGLPRLESLSRAAAAHAYAWAAAALAAVLGAAGSNSATGTRTRVARVRAEYPDQLDYSGFW